MYLESQYIRNCNLEAHLEHVELWFQKAEVSFLLSGNYYIEFYFNQVSMLN